MKQAKVLSDAELKTRIGSVSGDLSPRRLAIEVDRRDEVDSSIKKRG